jgi:hypothetical protein
MLKAQDKIFIFLELLLQHNFYHSLAVMCRKSVVNSTGNPQKVLIYQGFCDDVSILPWQIKSSLVMAVILPVVG